MDWLLEHLQLVVLAGLGLAGWLKSRYDARQTEEGTEFPSRPIGGPSGGPRPFVPPPIERKAKQSPTRLTVPPTLPTAGKDFAEELRRQQEIEERLRVIRDSRPAKAVSTGGAVATRDRVAARGKKQAVRPVISTLRQRLHNPAEVRAAIVLREILDRPLGLR
jgi:hypothetical protein